MAATPEHLYYLREPSLMGFSAELFGSSMRLPVLGAIFELTPQPEKDYVYSRQIISIVDGDPSNTFKEFQRAEKNHMISRCSKGLGRIINYERVSSPRWDIIEIALKTVPKICGPNPTVFIMFCYN